MSRPKRTSRDDEAVRHPHVPALPDELKAYIPYLLNQLTNRWNIEQNRSLSDYGINSTVLRTLSVLNIHKTLTINEIASYALVEQSNASRTLDTMVVAGLVERQIAETDLRRREVALTQKGEDLLRQLWPTMMRNHEKLVGDIPAKDIKACVATLLAMINNMAEKSD